MMNPCEITSMASGITFSKSRIIVDKILRIYYLLLIALITGFHQERKLQTTGIT
jgi:hypothetical protein